LEVFSRSPFISSTSLLQGVSPKPSDNILRRAVESAGASARSTGQGITKRAVAELPEASVEDRLRQEAEVANATPGIGSEIFYRISKSLATPSPNPTLLDYGISTLARNLLPQTPERAARELAKASAVETMKITERNIQINLEGKSYKLTVGPKTTILDAALDADIDMPYSCQSGLCTACRGKCLSGKVHMDEREGLSDEEIEEGYVLTCVGHPLTDDVVIEIG
jgi:2Fe-2S type ferredoxin